MLVSNLSGIVNLAVIFYIMMLFFITHYEAIMDFPIFVVHLLLEANQFHSSLYKLFISSRTNRPLGFTRTFSLDFDITLPFWHQQSVKKFYIDIVVGSIQKS